MLKRVLDIGLENGNKTNLIIKNYGVYKDLTSYRQSIN